jgi:hypothetical protein
MSWIRPGDSTNGPGSDSASEQWVLEGLQVMIELYLKSLGPAPSPVTDEAVEAWRLEAGRWARLLVFGLIEGKQISWILSVSACCQPLLRTFPISVIHLFGAAITLFNESC